MSSRPDLPRIEDWLIVMIAVHSFTVGVFLLFFTRWGVAFGGWQDLHLTFFARQVGAFHFVVAIGYLLEYFRYREVTFLLLTKIIAVLFLVSMMMVEPVPWALSLSALGDGLMALLVIFVHRRANRVRFGRELGETA
ncbi:MAG: hypothetical protein P8Y44_05805 [Acidobacteriota bacterium]